jgi:hypothetical protein
VPEGDSVALSIGDDIDLERPVTFVKPYPKAAAEIEFGHMLLELDRAEHPRPAQIR